MLFLCACCISAYASGELAGQPRGAQLSSFPHAAFPAANMQSTSALLNPTTVAMPGYSGRMATRQVTVNAQMMSYAPLYTNAMNRKSVRSSSFSTAGMTGVSLSAVSISRDNFNDVNAGNNSLNVGTPSSPRRGRDEPDDPSDPPGMDTPVGDMPFVLLVAMILLYVLYKMSLKRKLYFTKCK